MADFSPYIACRDKGASALTVWRQAEADGMDPVSRIRLLRELFGLTLIEAKAVSIQARTGANLQAYQEGLVEGLAEALTDEATGARVRGKKG